MPGVFKIKNLQDAEFTLTHPDGVGAVGIDSNNIAKSDVVNAALALKANTADLKEIGVGQTWQSFTVGTQRIADTTYTNTTGKPIEVIVSSYGGTNNDMWVYLDSGVGFRIGIGNVNTGNAFCAGSVIIPSGSTYKITAIGALHSWTELR